MIEMKCLEVTLVVGCPNMCEYCPQQQLLEKYNGIKVMSFDTYKRCLRKVMPEVEVHFSAFGEPLLNPDIVRMVKYTVERAHDLTIFTTLINISLDDLKKLAEFKYKDFVIHAISEEETSTKLDRKYYEKLKYAAAGNFNSTTFIVTEKTPLKSMNIIRNCNFQKLQKIGRGGLLPELNWSKYHNGKIWCTRLDQPALMPNGDLYICSIDFGLKHKIGNLLEQSVKEIESGEKKRQFLLDMDFGKIEMCNNCEYARPSYFGCKKIFPIRHMFSKFLFDFRKAIK